MVVDNKAMIMMGRWTILRAPASDKLPVLYSASFLLGKSTYHYHSLSYGSNPAMQRTIATCWMLIIVLRELGGSAGRSSQRGRRWGLGGLSTMSSRTNGRNPSIHAIPSFAQVLCTGRA